MNDFFIKKLKQKEDKKFKNPKHFFQKKKKKKKKTKTIEKRKGVVQTQKKGIKCLFVSAFPTQKARFETTNII